MRILFLGDIVGKKGREVIRDFLPSLKDKYQPDFIIANGENAAHGKGITIKIYNELISYGINAITMGNHTFSKNEIMDHLNEMDKLICPINHTKNEGKGYRIFKVNGEKLCIINCLGTVMQEDYTTSPYNATNDVLTKTLKDDVNYYVVDLHAEATAEKRVYAEYYKDKINAVLGTHTHVQTADEQLLSNKVGFISDVGMCGAFDSVLGRDTNECIDRTVNGVVTRYTISENPPLLCGVFIKLNNNVCEHIERIQIRP